jgi:hypothetical protein
VRSESVFPYLPNQVRTAPRHEAAAAGTDLQSQFEELLDAVWAAEENWRFDDRLDMALKLQRDRAA